jgi:hypothetical protein
VDDDRGQDVDRDGSPSGRFQGAGGLRIGTAERQRAVELLREHTSAGRLELEEFEERVAAAHQARTAPDLDGLFRDLPPLDSSGGTFPSGWSPSRGANGSDWNKSPHSWAPATANRSPRRWAVGGLVPIWVVVAVFVVAAASSGAYFFWPILWVFAFFFIARRWGRGRGYYRGWGGYGRGGWYGPSGGYNHEGWHGQESSGSSDRHSGPSTWV